jgi:LL-diaminopimelate aminotransferase
MKFAQRINRVPPYLFVEISRKIAKKKAEGADVISFGIGDPDIPTPDSIIAKLAEASLDSTNHRYPETDGLPELRLAMSQWYHRRFGIELDPDTEILPLIGAKEGIAHASLCFIDSGDIALVPDPGYPVYSVGTWFAGGECEWMPLTPANNWLPDLSSISDEIASKAKVMWINYPNNPTGAIADQSFFKSAVEFALKHDIALLHDAAYTETYFDGYKPTSMLNCQGGMEAGIEFHSLSKSYNMTGWRVGMAVGNAKMIQALMTVKSNIDSGIPQAIQYMAIEALNMNDNQVRERNDIYESRRNKVVETLNSIGIQVDPPKASLYVWAPVPAGYDSATFTSLLLDEADIVVTPGSGYGPSGEGYIRLSLTINDNDMERGLARLKALDIPNR